VSERALWSWIPIALLAWGVFAMGAARPWGYLPLLIGIATYGTAALLRPGERPLVSRGLLLSLAMITGTVFLQLVPIPSTVLDLLSPARMSIASVNTSSISVDPPATALGLAFVSALVLFFLGLLRTMAADGARRLAAGSVALGTLVALVGILETSTSWGNLYAAAWMRLPPDSMPHGPFSSRNHYAGWMLMTLALTMGYLCARLDDAGLLGGANRQTPARPRHRIGLGSMLVLQCAAFAMAIALVQTRSRAGVACLGLAVGIFGLLLVRHGTSTRVRLLVTSLLLLLPLTGVAVAGVQPIVDRFAADSWWTAHGRLPIWRQAAAIAADFALTGSGFNTYQRIVQLYPSAQLDEPYEAAHNDYLQLAAEGGLLVGVPALAALAFFSVDTRGRLREKATLDASTRWVRVGAVVGLMLIAVQESVEFSLQIPGNAVLFVVLAAIAAHRSPMSITHPVGRTT
jgi:O-antigen ligase